jgi:hypothetical protein
VAAAPRLGLAAPEPADPAALAHCPKEWQE